MNENLPARAPETPARLRPFFLMIKLDPMKALDTHASITPFKLLLLYIVFQYTNSIMIYHLS